MGEGVWHQIRTDRGGNPLGQPCCPWKSGLLAGCIAKGVEGCWEGSQSPRHTREVAQEHQQIQKAHLDAKTQKKEI